jgi:hypothetical protein
VVTLDTCLLGFHLDYGGEKFLSGQVHLILLWGLGVELELFIPPINLFFFCGQSPLHHDDFGQSFAFPSTNSLLALTSQHAHHFSGPTLALFLGPLLFKKKEKKKKKNKAAFFLPESEYNLSVLPER